MERIAVSRPEPGPFTTTSTLRTPCSIARRAVATVVKPDDEDETDEHDERNGAGASNRGDAGSDSPRAEVTDDDASLEATQRRLFGRRN